MGVQPKIYSKLGNTQPQIQPMACASQRELFLDLMAFMEGNYPSNVHTFTDNAFFDNNRAICMNLERTLAVHLSGAIHTDGISG